MPHGSHSPLTLRLTELFGTRAGLAKVRGIGPKFLAQGLTKMQERAGHVQYRRDPPPHRIWRNAFEGEHLKAWPVEQQELIRALLIHSIRVNRRIVFDWEEDSTTSTTIMDFGETLAVTFRSPRDYPPYTKA